jgi:hypothetical protein
LDIKSRFLIAVAFALWMTVLACSVNVKDQGQGKDSKVDINTPIGGVHINEDVDPHDTGMAVYPGAKKKEKSDKDSSAANVNISSSFFGVKVAAIEYESDDPPEKLIAFYQDQLKKYGHVIQCKASKAAQDLSVTGGEHGSDPVSCKGSNGGDVTELKVGTEGNQHFVSIEPKGKGSDFSLVYIVMRGKEGTI